MEWLYWPMAIFTMLTMYIVAGIKHEKLEKEFWPHPFSKHGGNILCVVGCMMCGFSWPIFLLIGPVVLPFVFVNFLLKKFVKNKVKDNDY